MQTKFSRSARQSTARPARQLTAKEAKVRAEAQFKARQERKADAPIAMREYREGQKAALNRMSQLRAERLGREAVAKA